MGIGVTEESGVLWGRWGHREDWGGIREKRWVMRKRLDIREGDVDVGILVCNEEGETEGRPGRYRGDWSVMEEIGVL